jgi:diguanylate cyclase (GGDEF)-like protein
VIGKDTPAAIDVLTGALGRRLFEAELARAVQQAREKAQPLALLYLDVDELLELNDVQGQAHADRALACLAQLACEVSGGVGPLGRVEGGAFALILPRVGPSRALGIAEAIRLRVAQTDHEGEDDVFQLTVSVGVAPLRSGEPWGNLLEAAEEACRRAKISGRNRVTMR